MTSLYRRDVDSLRSTIMWFDVHVFDAKKIQKCLRTLILADVVCTYSPISMNANVSYTGALHIHFISLHIYIYTLHIARIYTHATYT